MDRKTSDTSAHAMPDVFDFRLGRSLSSQGGGTAS